MNTPSDTIIECIKKYDLSLYESKLKDILESITDLEEKSVINYMTNQHKYKKNKIENLNNIVSKLQKLELPEQRSPEWYE